MNHKSGSRSAFLLRTGTAGVALALFSLTFATAQTANVNYTDALPSVEKVKAQLKGSDPIDRIARQVAVFTYLQTYIERIKLNRDYRGTYTAGEQRLRNDYSLAAYQLSQEFSKTHTAAEVKSFQQKEGQYEINNALDWIKQLEGQQAGDTYRGTEASLAQTYKGHEDKLQKQMKQDQGSGRSSIAGDPVLDPTGTFARAEANRVKDPELRRCLELGESLDACESVGAMQGVASILVPFAEKSDPSERPSAAGIVLVGDYQGRSGFSSVSFGSALGSGSPVAFIRDCGSLVTTIVDGHDYTLQKSGTSVQLVLANEPQPIVIGLQPGGTLSGPGSVLVKGRIITGYSTTTKSVMVNGAPAAAQGYDCNGPCSTSSSIPTYATKIERCNIGPMSYVHPKLIAAPKTGIGFLDAITKTTPIVTGFRMTGHYVGASGLALDFENDAVILDCGKAHAKSPYTVDNSPTGFVVRIQNAGGAFLVAVAPDNTLRGSGTTTVTGRLVTQIRGDNVSFTSHSESCNVNSFAARAKRNTMASQSIP